MRRYGVPHFAKTQAFKDMWKNPEFVKAYLEKQIATKRANNSFHISKPERQVEKMLIAKFGKDNVLSQYKDENRYPYLCDFYIKSFDLFIECNFHWTHNKHLFDANSEQDIQRLEFLRKKAVEKRKVIPDKDNAYETAIQVWTERDPLKLKTAKSNKLNYVIFWTLEDAKAFLGINNNYVV